MTTRVDAAQKRDFVRELFRADKLAKPAEVVKQVTQRFHSGMARNEIAQIREEFGVRLGPRGIPVEVPARKPGQQETVQHIQTTQDNGQRLNKLLREVQAELAALGVERVMVPAHGKASVYRMVSIEVDTEQR